MKRKHCLRRKTNHKTSFIEKCYRFFFLLSFFQPTAHLRDFGQDSYKSNRTGLLQTSTCNPTNLKQGVFDSGGPNATWFNHQAGQVPDISNVFSGHPVSSLLGLYTRWFQMPSRHVQALVLSASSQFLGFAKNDVKSTRLKKIKPCWTTSKAVLKVKETTFGTFKPFTPGSILLSTSVRYYTVLPTPNKTYPKPLWDAWQVDQKWSKVLQFLLLIITTQRPWFERGIVPTRTTTVCKGCHGCPEKTLVLVCLGSQKGALQQRQALRR